MNERQQALLENLRVEAHLARSMSITAPAFHSKLNALKAGKTPILSVVSGVSFSDAYKTAQIEFWRDLVTIGLEKLKELEIL